jgi:N-acyl-D-amino-acid deacylase
VSRLSSPSVKPLLLFVVSALLIQPAEAPYDLLIRNARIVDGTGSPWVGGDLAVRGDTIVAIGRHLPGHARLVIEAAGQVLAPGFIDLHTHARRGIFDVPTADNYIRQGVTTLIEGPDGSSPLPLGPFLDRIETTRVTPNMGSFVGQGSIRESVVGLQRRAATPAEIDRMRDLVKTAMGEGALGLSSGLLYVPGNYSSTEEVAALAKEAGLLGGIYITHMRDEASEILKSVRETIAIGEQGDLPSQITHHKIIGRRNWGRSVETLRLVDEARARGLDVTIDQYPYTASSTGIAVLLPQWALEGGQQEVVKRLDDEPTRVRIRQAIIENLREDRGGGDPKNVVIASCSWDASLAGKNLADLAIARGLEPSIDRAADVVIDLVRRGGAQAVFHAIDESDVERILRHPATMVASDGEVTIFGKGAPHPRSYGTFARVVAVYVREKNIVTLEDAVRKMTSMPALRIGLRDRGLLRPGMKADLCVFDPARVRDRATFREPHQYAEGFSLVVINGQVVFDGTRMTDARPGRVLRGSASVVRGARRL